MRTHPVKAAAAALVLLAPEAALAAGAQLAIQQVDFGRSRWPHARAYVSVLGASGAPIPNLSQDLFKVYEQGNSDGSKVEKVESLEAAGTGASLAVVVQASGAMMGIQEELKKALAAFVNGLSEKDQVAVVDYSDAVETVAPFSEDKGEVAAKIAGISFTGRSFLLYDGLAQALSLFPGPGGKSGWSRATLPAAKAILVVSDGRDSGSAADLEKLISDAVERRIPIHAIGHSEVDQDSLPRLGQIARRTGGTYKAAPGVDDIHKALRVIQDAIGKLYVVQWKSQLPHDGKDHKIEVAMVGGGASLQSSVVARTPGFTDWMFIALVAVLLALLLLLALWAARRRRGAPSRTATSSPGS